MKIVIIEDEIPALNLLTTILKKINPNYEIVAKLQSVEEAIIYLQNPISFDILFLDVELSDGSSFEIFKTIQQFSKPIIIVTAYPQYALDAFKINSIAYVLKPISQQTISEAIQKMEHYKTVLNIAEFNPWPSEKKMEAQQERKYIIRLGNRIMAIELKDIKAFYSKDKMTYVYIDEQRQYPIDKSLDELEQELQGFYHFRINRQLIITRAEVKEIKKMQKAKLEVITIFTCPVASNISSEKSAKFKQWYQMKY